VGGYQRRWWSALDIKELSKGDGAPEGGGAGDGDAVADVEESWCWWFGLEKGERPRREGRRIEREGREREIPAVMAPASVASFFTSNSRLLLLSLCFKSLFCAESTATAENTRRAAAGMAFAIAGVGLGKMGLAVAC
ncbi:hypothetical protein U1Q18_017841, partial [Sarracenia purpurea var. burkii]